MDTTPTSTMDTGAPRATRALTLIECIKRLHSKDSDATTQFDALRASAHPGDAPAAVDGSATLTIHLVGADHREGNSAQETLSIFEQFFQYLAVDDQRFSTLQLVMVGPNVAQKLHQDYHEATHMDNATVDTSDLAIQVELSYYVGSFDDYYDEKDLYRRPDLAVCFNAGVWGYDQWLPTLRLLVHTIRTPLLITSYNKNEAIDDEDTLEDEVSVTRWFWRAEKNPSGSLEHRSTQNTIGSVLRENDYWMCVRPDAQRA